MSQWHSSVYKHGAHLVGVAAGKSLPAWVNGSGFLREIGAPAPVWGSNGLIRNMARKPSGAFWMSEALRGTYQSHAWHRRSKSRYPWDEWRSAWTITITGPFQYVNVTMGWIPIGRAHDNGGSATQIWAQLHFYNAAGAHMGTRDFGQIEWAGENEIGYSGTNTRTPLNNVYVACPAGTGRVDFRYDMYSGGYEAHDAGDRSPGSWNPDLSIAAGGIGMGMLMGDNQEDAQNNVRL